MVLDGAVDIHSRDAEGEHVDRLTAGRIYFAEPGEEHVARPAPEAPILVIERKGSV